MWKETSGFVDFDFGRRGSKFPTVYLDLVDAAMVD